MYEQNFKIYDAEFLDWRWPKLFKNLNYFCFPPKALGAKGHIKDVTKNGDFFVTFGNKTWLFSPVCIVPLENEDVDAKTPADPTKNFIMQQRDKASTSMNGNKSTLNFHFICEQKIKLHFVILFA